MWSAPILTATVCGVPHEPASLRLGVCLHGKCRLCRIWHSTTKEAVSWLSIHQALSLGILIRWCRQWGGRNAARLARRSGRTELLYLSTRLVWVIKNCDPPGKPEHDLLLYIAIDRYTLSIISLPLLKSHLGAGRAAGARRVPAKPGGRLGPARAGPARTFRLCAAPGWG